MSEKANDCSCKKHVAARYWCAAIQSVAGWAGIVAIIYLVIQCKSKGL